MKIQNISYFKEVNFIISRRLRHISTLTETPFLKTFHVISMAF